ncbi:capsule assembly Wzi family protein [Pleionea litopenaei]|uniref:Capsule assembly Wzi family protein n=1 Tax=Pleionea litopenaei TaxID=3070815 RepID=A0AA51RTB1_9GAMM|nr:capsule assembly Wzi family protein [Pleionea sp. HL-JVS1]WMS87273.1 capsule assembly Wzi family protein [Pleionea sp. HL-JVS1]
MKKLFLMCLWLTLTGVPLTGRTEPFIKTDDAWLRADIETLANIGVIKSPVSTYPLTWGPILKDLSEVKLNNISEQYHTTYFRVLRKGRSETGKNSNYSEIRANVSQENQMFRYFGDSARGERELSTRVTGMSNNFAWNLEVTLSPDSIDGDDKRFDGSYFSAIAGNWIFSIGQIEKWWGPGYQHSIIMSNNAKPTPAFMFQRNYSEPFETPLLSWMGPWTLTSFVGMLDDSRVVNDAKLLGLSLSFKPLQSLEIGLRRTAQWGGDGRPENFDSFTDLLIGLDNCDEGNLTCDDEFSEPGNQLAGIDVTWRPLTSIPGALYFQTVGEDEAGYMPSKKSWMYGASFPLLFNDSPITVNFEVIDTSVDGDGNDPSIPFTGYNVLYEHSIYSTGYRYRDRSIGSTLDNDSVGKHLSMIYESTDYGKFVIRLSNLNINQDNEDRPGVGGNYVSSNELEFSEIIVRWNWKTSGYGEFTYTGIFRDEQVISNLGALDKQSLGIEWKYKF